MLVWRHFEEPQPLHDGRLAPLDVDATVNVQFMLHREMVVAKKRDLISVVPEFEWLRAPRPEFDFLDFEEAERLVAAADGEWKTMILVALKTGMRQGELLALRWEDVDLVKGQVHVQRSVTRGVITEPKSNRARMIPLSEGTRRALTAHRHLRASWSSAPRGPDVPQERV